MKSINLVVFVLLCLNVVACSAPDNTIAVFLDSATIEVPMTKTLGSTTFADTYDDFRVNTTQPWMNRWSEVENAATIEDPVGSRIFTTDETAITHVDAHWDAYANVTVLEDGFSAFNDSNWVTNANATLATQFSLIGGGYMATTDANEHDYLYNWTLNNYYSFNSSVSVLFKLPESATPNLAERTIYYTYLRNATYIKYGYNITWQTNGAHDHIVKSYRILNNASTFLATDMAAGSLNWYDKYYLQIIRNDDNTVRFYKGFQYRSAVYPPNRNFGALGNETLSSGSVSYDNETLWLVQDLYSQSGYLMSVDYYRMHGRHSTYHGLVLSAAQQCHMYRAVEGASTFSTIIEFQQLNETYNTLQVWVGLRTLTGWSAFFYITGDHLYAYTDLANVFFFHLVEYQQYTFYISWTTTNDVLFKVKTEGTTTQHNLLRTATELSEVRYTLYESAVTNASHPYDLYMMTVSYVEAMFVSQPEYTVFSADWTLNYGSTFATTWIDHHSVEAMQYTGTQTNDLVYVDYYYFVQDFRSVHSIIGTEVNNTGSFPATNSYSITHIYIGRLESDGTGVGATTYAGEAEFNVYSSLYGLGNYYQRIYINHIGVDYETFNTYYVYFAEAGVYLWNKATDNGQAGILFYNVTGQNQYKQKVIKINDDYSQNYDDGIDTTGWWFVQVRYEYHWHGGATTGTIRSYLKDFTIETGPESPEPVLSVCDSPKQYSAPVAGGFVENIVNAFSNAIKWLSGLFGGIGDRIWGFFSGYIDQFVEFLGNIQTGIGALVEGIIDYALSIFSTIVDYGGQGFWWLTDQLHVRPWFASITTGISTFLVPMGQIVTFILWWIGTSGLRTLMTGCWLYIWVMPALSRSADDMDWLGGMIDHATKNISPFFVHFPLGGIVIPYILITELAIF